MAGRYTVEGVFSAVDRFTRPVSRMQQRLRTFGGESSRSLQSMNRMADGFASGLRRVGMAAVAAGAALAVVGANVVQTGAEFEQSLTSAAARMGGSVTRGTEAYAAMEEAARRVGAETEHTASAAAAGLGFLAMAGYTAEQSIAALPTVVNLATATGLELARATDIITDSMGPLGLATDDAAQAQINLARVSDVLAATSTRTNTNVEQMFEAIVAGGNMATAAGQSVEGFSALVGSMANDGIKGEAAGTALRNMFMRLQAPSSRAAGLLRRFHVEVADGDGNMRDMADVIADLSQGMAGLGGVARNAALTDIFGARAVGPALSLINQGAESIRGLRGELENAGGATDQMASQMRDTTGGDMASFMSMVESIKLQIFEVVRGPLREVIGALIEWGRAHREVIASGIQDFMTSFAENLDTIVARGQGLAVLVTGFAAVALGIKAVTAAQAIFNAVSAANPYVLAIMAIIAAIALVVAYWPEISAFFSWLWDGAKEVAAGIGQWFSEAWDSVVGGVTAAFDWVSAAFMGWIDFLWGIHVTMLEIGLGLAMVLLEPFMPAIEAVVAAFRWLVDVVVEYFEFMWADLTARATAVGAWFSALWNRIAAFAAPAIEMIKGYFAFMWDDIQSRAQSVYDTFTSIWGGLTSFFAGIWEGVVAGFNEYIMPLINAAAGFVSAIRGIGAGALGTDGADGDGADPQVVSPSERVARDVSETTTNSSATVTIRDASSRTRSTMTGGGPGVRLQRSGAL